LNFKEILELIDKVSESGIGAVEVEQAGTKVRIEGKPAQQQVITVSHPQADAASQPASQQVYSAPQPAETRAEEKKRLEEESEAGLHIITSPIVGTFYRAPNPESPSFVSEGDRISVGKVLCIVEAMKLMNEIESEVEGTLVRIYPQNGQPIEYGEKLFAVRV
jgi:acetyl-CoA carboxylase biotin carboxyl carrier protein